MVIDEDRAFLELMSVVLDSTDREIETTEEHLATVDAVRDISPDLVILDLRSHGRESFDLLFALKDDAATKPIPVIACAAIPAEVTELQDWLRQHRVTLLPKPFDIEALTHLADQALARRCA